MNCCRISKCLQNSQPLASNLQKSFWITRTIFFHGRLEQFSKQNTNYFYSTALFQENFFSTIEPNFFVCPMHKGYSVFLVPPLADMLTWHHLFRFHARVEIISRVSFTEVQLTVCPPLMRFPLTHIPLTQIPFLRSSISPSCTRRDNIKGILY